MVTASVWRFWCGRFTFPCAGAISLAGALLGLGIAANLTIAFPAAGVIACPILLGEGNWEMRTRRILTLAIPAAAIAALICYPALSAAHASQFYVGEPTPGAALFELIFTFIRASVNRLGLFGTGYGAHLIEYLFLPAVMIFILVACVRTFLRDPASRPSLIPAVALLAALLELVAAHYLAGINYPVDRVGLYLFLLLGLAWAIGCLPTAVPTAAGGSGRARRPVGCSSSSHSSRRAISSCGRSTFRRKRSPGEFARTASGKRRIRVSLSATWYQQPALEFYRYYYRIAALKPVERHAKTLLEGFDYYVLNRQGR